MTKKLTISVAVFAAIVLGAFMLGAAKPEYDVTAFGATPNDGLSDTAAFQAAFDAAKADGPAKVVIPRGTYLMTDKITLDGATDIDVIAYGAEITATVRISPWWFAFQNCTNIHWYGGYFSGPETTSTFHDRHISLEGVDRTITAIATDETISVLTDFGDDTSYDHGLEVGDSVTITGSNSTPSVNGTWTVSALDEENPRGKFRITGVDVTVAGTTGTIEGLGEPAIQSCTTGNPASPPVVTVDSTSGLVDGMTIYINHTAVQTGISSQRPGPLISLDGTGGGSGTRSAIDGLRTVDVLTGTTFTFTDTAATDIPTVTSAQTVAAGKVQHGIDDSPGVDAAADNRRMGDLEGSRLFWFTKGELNGLHNVRASGLDALIFIDTCNKWICENFRFTGPFTEGWDTGLRCAAYNDHKQVILPTYAVQIEGGFDWVVRDGFVEYASGAVAGGTGNPLKIGETDQIEAYGSIENILCEWFFDNGIYETGRGINVRRCTLRNGLGGGVGVKVRGWNNTITHCTAEGCDSGFGIEGALTESTLDDNFGAGAASAEISYCIARNCSTAGIWTDDNAGVWPRDLRITHNHIINCGSLATTMATPNLPAISQFGDRETVLNAQTRSPVKLYNVNRLDFTNNTIDDSETGGIAAVGETDDGYLAIKLAENHFSARRFGFRSYLTVSGCSNAAYNGTHFVVDVVGTPGITPGTNDTGAGFWLKTTTTYAGTSATVGSWAHPRNDYAIYVGNAGGGSGNGQTDVTGSTIKDNKVIGSKVGFRLVGVSDTEITGNQGYEINGASPTGDQRSALFSIVNLRRSIFDKNSVKPLGDRLLFVESGGTYSGITASNNIGEITTDLASATATPNLSGAVLWMDSDRNLDLTPGTRGDENVLYPTGINHINADTWVINDTAAANGFPIAAWCDHLTRSRFKQGTTDKKPAYKMTATYSGGDDANLLNGYCVVRFDGGDMMKLQSATSYAQRGTIYIVAKRTSDASTTQTIFSTADEDTDDTYIQVQENASTGRVQFRLKNHGSDTETLVTSAAAAVPINTWKIIRITTNETNVTMAVSNGAGAMATSTGAASGGTDGRWFGDVSRDGLLWRDSTTIGAHIDTNVETNHFTGDIACILIYDGDVSANHAAIEAALFSKYGAL